MDANWSADWSPLYISTKSVIRCLAVDAALETTLIIVLCLSPFVLIL
jgi:hypothetical protein